MRPSITGVLVTASIAVVAIMLFYLPSMEPTQLERRAAFTRAQILQVDDAVQAFVGDHSRLPASLEELMPAYLPTGFSDSWGRQFHYSLEGQSDFRIYTYGADGRFGGEGLDRDLDNDTNWSELL